MRPPHCLKKKVNPFPFTLVLYIKNPLFLHPARVRAAFATHDDPRYAVKVEDTDRANEGFDREKTNRNRCDFKVCYSPRCQAIFDGHTEPYVFPGRFSPSICVRDKSASRNCAL